MNGLALTALMLLALASRAVGIDLNSGDSVTIQLDDHETIWTGDGFALDCPPSHKCRIDTRKLGVGSFRIVYSKSSDQRARYGETILNISGSSSHQSFEVATTFTSELTPASPYTVAIKKFGFLMKKKQTKIIKDIPRPLSGDETIETVPESLTFSQVSSSLSSIQFGASEMKVIAGDNIAANKATFAWQHGHILFQIPPEHSILAQNYSIISSSPSAQKSQSTPKVFISSYKNGFIAIPVQGAFEIKSNIPSESKKSGVLIQPPFAMWIDKDQKKVFSLLSCDDASDLIRTTIAAAKEYSCEDFNVKDQLDFEMRAIDLSKLKPENPHAEGIVQQWIKSLFRIEIDQQKKLELQIATEDALDNRYDLKLKYWLSQNSCMQIGLSSPNVEEEKNLKKYYEGLCAKRDKKVISARNRWSWLINKMVKDPSREYSIYSHSQMTEPFILQGHIGLYLGRDTNPMVKPENIDESPFEGFSAKNLMVYGGENRLKYSMNSDSSLKFHLLSEGDFSIFAAHGKIPLFKIAEDLSFQSTYSTDSGESVEIGPKVMVRGSGYFVDIAGLGLDLGLEKSGFKVLFSIDGFEDFNDFTEYFDPLSGNSIDLKSGIPSNRPFHELRGLLAHQEVYSQGSWEIYTQKKYSRYRFDVEKNESFNSWALGTRVTHRPLPLVNFEGEVSFEMRRFNIGMSGQNVKFALSSSWDLLPDYSASIKYEYLSAKSQLLCGTWHKHKYLLGIRMEFR